MVAGESVTRGKPDPEGYLLAAKLLGRLPEACIVFEDAPAGIAAGIAAGTAIAASTAAPSQDTSSTALVDAATSALGGLDILVNNAGGARPAFA